MVADRTRSRLPVLGRGGAADRADRWETFALTFESGRWLLRLHLLDRDFGLDLALRVLDSNAVRQARRQYLSANARTDTNLVPAGQELWSFGIREHAELVRQLAGTILSGASVDLSHSAVDGPHLVGAG